MQQKILLCEECSIYFIAHSRSRKRCCDSCRKTITNEKQKEQRKERKRLKYINSSEYLQFLEYTEDYEPNLYYVLKDGVNSITIKDLLWFIRREYGRKERQEALEFYRENRKWVNGLLKHRVRFKYDPAYKMYFKIRGYVGRALKGNYKKDRTIEYLGCTPEYLVKHLEAQFQPGMSWENYGNKTGQWSVDHIIPVSWCDPFNDEQVKRVCNYINLRPMWHIDNIRKGNRGVFF